MTSENAIALYLGLAIAFIYGFCWCVDTFLAKRPVHEHAYVDAQNVLRRANRDLVWRARLKQWKE